MFESCHCAPLATSGRPALGPDLPSGGGGQPSRSSSCAIILAGGRGERLGGVDKAGLRIGSVTLLDHLLDAVAGLTAVVVGSASARMPATVLWTVEDPPGGGPAAGVVAGLVALDRADVSQRPASSRHNEPRSVVAVIAVDQPGVTADTVRRLLVAMKDPQRHGVVLVDDDRRHHTIGAFDRAALRARIAERPEWHGRSLRELLDPLVSAEVPAVADESRDVDTPQDWEYWAR